MARPKQNDVQMVEVRLKRNFFPLEDVKKYKGDIVEVTLEEAKLMVNAARAEFV